MHPFLLFCFEKQFLLNVEEQVLIIIAKILKLSVIKNGACTMATAFAWEGTGGGQQER